MPSPLTPQQEYPDLAAAIYAEFSGDQNAEAAPFKLFLKREDLHPYGSHKGRSIPHMIDHWLSKGTTKFALSSSGNAALAAAMHIVTKPGAELHIYCGLKIAPSKLAKLKTAIGQNTNITIHQVERPLQALSVVLERDADTASLRQSTDDIAVQGYASLIDELSTLPDLTNVFIGTSSGTTATALVKGFDSGATNIVHVNIIQTTSCHPIATALGIEIEDFSQKEEVSLADAIVDKTALRSKTLVPLIKQNGGQAYIADNHLIIKAQELVAKYAGFTISPNSALSIVGLCKMLYTETPTGSVVCMICGD